MAARSWGQVRGGVGRTPPFPCQTVDLIGAGFWVRRGHQIRIPRKATAARATCDSGATSMATKAKTVAVKDNENEEKVEADDETDNELVEVTSKAVTETKKSEPGERTDDPVRMYLREIGTVELLSREGEIAIAKRIEAGRDTMIRGLCESALTFEAIMVWREELASGRILLREVIDLEQTYGGGPGDGPPPGALGEEVEGDGDDVIVV